MKHLNDYINEDLLWDQYYYDNIELYEGKIWNNIKNWFKNLFNPINRLSDDDRINHLI